MKQKGREKSLSGEENSGLRSRFQMASLRSIGDASFTYGGRTKNVYLTDRGTLVYSRAAGLSGGRAASPAGRATTQLYLV